MSEVPRKRSRVVTPLPEKVCGATIFPTMLHYGAVGGVGGGGVTVTGITFEVLSPHTALKFS